MKEDFFRVEPPPLTEEKFRAKYMQPAMAHLFRLNDAALKLAPMNLLPPLRPRHYGYPHAAPVLRRDTRLLFAAMVCLGAFVGIAAAFWVLNA